MALKHIEENEKEIELETWPAFVDILSSTVVVLAFAFFILVVVLSMLKVTSSERDARKDGEGGSTTVVESTLLSEKSSKFPQFSIIAPPVLAKGEATKNPPTTDIDKAKVIKVPENAEVSDKEIKVTEVGKSKKQVLGDIPKFVDSRVMDVLKELIMIQQDVIVQQRKVIEQQDTKIKETTREYQSLLALITKTNDVEDIKQKINPKPDQAKFIDLNTKGEKIAGPQNKIEGKGLYVLSPPEVAIKDVTIDHPKEDEIIIHFNDNANYLNDENMQLITDSIKKNIVSFKSKGVILLAKPSDFSISSAEAKRIAVDRLLLIQSILISMGVDKSLIKFKTINNNIKPEEESYGWVEIIPN